MNKNGSAGGKFTLDEYIKKEKKTTVKGKKFDKSKPAFKSKGALKNKRIEKKSNRNNKPNGKQQRPQHIRGPRPFKRGTRRVFSRPVYRTAPPLLRRDPIDLRKAMQSDRVKPYGRPLNQENKLIIRNLPMKFTNDELNELFNHIGYLVKCKLVYDNFGKSKGKGEVVYEDPRDARKAIESLHGNRLDDKIISVEMARNSSPSPERVQRDPYDEHDSRLGGRRGVRVEYQRRLPDRVYRGRKRYQRY